MPIELLLVASAIGLLSALLARVLARLPKWLRIGLGVSLSALVVLYGTWRLARAPWQVIGDTFSGLETGEKVVALTFDDGPSREFTAPVLAALEREGVRGTFFLIGESADANPAEARAIVAAGHEVGNHSYTHQRMIFCSPAFVASEIERTDAALRRAGARGPFLFRSPFSKKLVVLPYYLASHDRTNVFWTVDADSTSRFSATADRLASHVIANARPGSIVLMHVMYAGRQVSRDALPLIIRGLRGRGFDFVTVSELMQKRQR